MPPSLPADPTGAPRLTDVLPDVVASLSGGSVRWPAASSVILFVVDGLGAANLAEHTGYARFLAGHRGRRRVAASVFPSTTAAALTSLLTGEDVGQHGLVGYRALDPAAGVARNQLTDWGPRALDPLTWQRATPLTRTDAARWVVVSKPEYVDSGFTEATLRGAHVYGEKHLDDRVALALHQARAHPGSIVYLYAPEVDAAGHRHGVASDRWVAALEAVDAAARRLHDGAGPGVGVVLTADHGMVDVPRHRQIVLEDGDPRLADVALIAGEPRMLHLYATPGSAVALHDAWRQEEQTAWVFSRQEAIDAGLFGARVDADVEARIGDVLVAARGRAAYYDGRLADTSAQNMIGQHGSLTPEERIVPLIGLGAFAS